MGFSPTTHPFGGAPIYGNLQIIWEVLLGAMINILVTESTNWGVNPQLLLAMNSQCSLWIGHVRSVAEKVAQRSKIDGMSFVGDGASGIRKEAKACEGIKKKLLEDGCCP